MAISEKVLKEIKELQKIYPDKTAALVPALHLVRNEYNMITTQCEAELAELFGVEPVRVHSVASFYTMLNQKPRGKYHLQFCDTLTCSMVGGESLLNYARELTGADKGGVSADGLFSITNVECLASCATGPVMQVNNEPFIENLTKEKLKSVVEELKAKRQ